MPTVDEQRNLIVSTLKNSGFVAKKESAYGISVSLKNRKISSLEVTTTLYPDFDELVDTWTIFSNGFNGVTIIVE